METFNKRHMRLFRKYRNPDPGCSFEVSNPHRLRNVTWSSNAARDFSVHLPSKSAAAEARMKGASVTIYIIINEQQH